MKKNQQSIDGFTPRRRVDSLNQNQGVKISQSNNNSKELGQIKDKVKNHNHDSKEDIELALQNLEIEENQENERKERIASKRHQKLLRKFEKKNAKREKKGKNPISFEQFQRRRIFKRAFIAIFIIALSIGAYQLYGIFQTLNKITNGNVLGVVFNEKKKLKSDNNGRTNILIFGTSPKGWDGENLTDSVMVASVNQENKKIYTVSLPRDLWVKHTCRSWLGTSAGKLNETYGCAYYDAQNSGMNEEDSEKAGQKALAEKAKEILGLDIQYVVHGNWKVLIDAINAVGGIDVKVEAYDGASRVYDVATKINYKSGETYHMNGDTALAFSRARGSEGGIGLSGSNFDRERNQQKILKAAFSKINQQKTNPAALLSIMASLSENVHHSFDSTELKTAAEIAQEFSGDKIISLPLVSETDQNANYFTTGMISSVSAVLPKAGTYDYSQIQSYISKSTISGEITEENAKIIVLNGTNYSGLAAQEQKSLEKEGFNIQDIDSAPTRDYTKTKVYYTKKDSKIATIKKLESKYSVKSEKIPTELNKFGENIDIIIVLGEDNGN